MPAALFRQPRAAGPWLRRMAGLLLVSLVCTFGAQAQQVQPIPALTARVIDRTGTLAPAEQARLEAKLQAFEQAQGSQMVVLIVPTTAPEEITDYTQRVGDAWKIGRKQVGDGLLLVVAKNDRTLRIAPAKALEGAVPDLAARRIIDETITPRFRQGDFAGGIDAGLDQLMRLIRGEGLPAPPAIRTANAAPDWTGLLVFLFVAVPVAARIASALLGRKLGALLTGGAIGVLAWWVSASLLLAGVAAGVGMIFALAASLAPLRGGRPGGWGGPPWGGGGSTWGGGGGFRSGGGGDFGGGGASGRW